MSESSVSSRIEASKRVMRTLAVKHPKIPLVRDAEGVAPIIVALPSEYASEVLARVRAEGGLANVVVAYAKYFEIMTFNPNRTATADLIINRDLSMGMLVLKIKENHGKTVRLQLRDEAASLPTPSLEFAYA